MSISFRNVHSLGSFNNRLVLWRWWRECGWVRAKTCTTNQIILINQLKVKINELIWHKFHWCVTINYSCCMNLFGCALRGIGQCVPLSSPSAQMSEWTYQKYKHRSTGENRNQNNNNEINIKTESEWKRESRQPKAGRKQKQFVLYLYIYL